MKRIDDVFRGLKLVSGKGPLEVIVIDYVEKPSRNWQWLESYIRSTTSVYASDCSVIWNTSRSATLRTLPRSGALRQIHSL
jgi:hypothetical protein